MSKSFNLRLIRVSKHHVNLFCLNDLNFIGKLIWKFFNYYILSVLIASLFHDEGIRSLKYCKFYFSYLFFYIETSRSYSTKLDFLLYFLKLSNIETLKIWNLKNMITFKTDKNSNTWINVILYKALFFP